MRRNIELKIWWKCAQGKKNKSLVSIGELWQQRERKSTNKYFYFIQSLTSIGGCCAHKWRNWTIKFLQQSLPLPQKPRLQINQIVDCQEFLWIPKHPRKFINFPKIPKSQIFNSQEFLQIPWISQILNQYSSQKSFLQLLPWRPQFCRMFLHIYWYVCDICDILQLYLC